ncbi:hypothetical protein [Chromobacterium haemolyticum]|uniref:hypothetical protein n=1 Tax=Chromobacterium haemolyticum TaxID=394935 RepID=UPI000D302359|nr:hypothetical protein [Chromobacterium haemolyticum]PTU68214.1 hypothetical protein DBB33_01505 [Chromobacterium haemolyticum]
MTITGASSPRLTRSLSVPADALRRPATPLSESYSGGRSSAATPARRHSVSDPASFKAQHTRDSVASLFSASPQAKALYQLYRASPNVHAKGEIEEFAKVYAKLKQQPDLSPQDAKSLDDLARQYTARILKDGLGVESAFGPWLDSCKQQYKLRSELEHKLAVLANEHCGGDTMKLGNAFMLREVSTFILSYVETQLGRPLDVATGKQVLELVDSAARQAFDALRQSRDEMLRQSGPSLGRQARDLDTVAILPQLLRSVLAGLGQEAPPQAKPDLPDEPKGPDAPKPDPSAAPAGGPNITINVGGITIDNSVNITDSGNTSDSGNSSRSQRPARGRRDPSRLVQRLNLKMHQQQGAQRGSESGDGQTRRAAASGDGAGRSFRSMETQTEATGGRDGTSRTTEVQTPVTDLDTSRITVSSTDAERVVIPADASTQADDTTAASPLSFKLWRSSFPEVVLKSVIYQSDANKAAGALAQDIRTAMLLDSRGELDRGPLVQARDAFLPEPGSSVGGKLYGAAMSETAWQHLRQGLEQHPQQAQLRGQILKTARLTSIGKFEGDKDCVIRRLLNWASVQAPTAGQATTGAGRRVEGVLRRDPFNVQNLSSQPVAHAATAQRSQPLTAPTRTDTPPVQADGGVEPARVEPKAMDLRRQAFLQGMLNGATAAPAAQEVERLQSARPDLEAAEPSTEYFSPVIMNESTVKVAELRKNKGLEQLSVNTSLMDGLSGASKPADSVPAELTSMRFQPVTMSKLGVKVAELRQNKALDQLSASQALMDGLRAALKPVDDTPIETQQSWGSLLVEALSEGALKQQAALPETLRQALSTHPQRLVLAEFAQRLRDQTNLCPSVAGGPYPLVGALLEGLGVSAKAPSRVITTVDGKYFDVSGVKGAAQ